LQSSLTTNPAIVVPEWQRNYSWSTSEAETFWSDLLRFDATGFEIGNTGLVELIAKHKAGQSVKGAALADAVSSRRLD
jgi:hypothetical protein